MKNHHLFAALIPIALALPATAQAGRGTVTGTISDAQGIPLQGVRLTLTPSAVVTVSDATGQYTFLGIPAGSYTLTAAYAGFDPLSAPVTVAAGQALRFDSALKIAANTQNVDVYAGRQGGEVEAINRTVNADNIINVLPADVIISLPNANIADALGRLPSVTLERDEGEGKYVQIRGTEPRLTNVTIDGVNIASAETVRQIKLDIIPADLVESVQINKTLQANMEGDGIGGSVDLRTKSATDSPTVYVESLGGYTPIIGGRPAYQFDGTLGKRFLPGKKLGMLGSASYDWNGRGINDVEPGPFLLGGYDARDYQYYRSRFGVGGTIDYRFSDTSSIYLKGLYALFHNYGNRWDYNLTTGLTAAGQPDGTGSSRFGAEIRRPVQDLGSIQLGGHHVITRSLFNWDLESSVGRTKDNGYSDATFRPIAGTPLAGTTQFNLNIANPLVPVLTATNANLFDPTQYFYASERIQFQYDPEVDLGLGGSLATSYSIASHPSTFEFGGRFRNVHKFENVNTRNFTPAAALGSPQLALTNFLGDFTDPSYYGNQYPFGPTASYDKINAFTGKIEAPRALGNTFNLLEKISAGYLMNTVDLGRFRLVAGLRIENTSENDTGTTPTSTTATSVRKGSYINVLPSASVRYGITPSSGLRLVYGRGLSRPNFSDLVAFANVAPGGVRTLRSIGNPNLRAEKADNLDLLYERTFSSSGLLQAGIYYKNLKDPILPINTSTPDPANPGSFIITTTPQNAGSAYVYGAEIAFQQRFTYLPGLFNGLGLSANYGYSASKVTFPPYDPNAGTGNQLGRNDSPHLLRQAPHTWNISPTYDKRRLSVRLGLSYNAANIFQYNYSDAVATGPFDPTTGSGGGIKGPNGDVYLYAHLQVDLQGTYNLGEGFSAVAYGLNLNNEVFRLLPGQHHLPHPA